MGKWGWGRVCDVMCSQCSALIYAVRGLGFACDSVEKGREPEIAVQTSNELNGEIRLQINMEIVGIIYGPDGFK